MASSTCSSKPALYKTIPTLPTCSSKPALYKTIPALPELISGLIPDLSKDSINDLLQLHNLYIKGTTNVSAEIGVPKGGALCGRQIVIIPANGTVIDLLQTVGEGCDKITRTILYIDANGEPSLRVLYAPKRGSGEHYAEIAKVSEQFHSRHVLRFQHFWHANKHYMLSNLELGDAYHHFYDWKKSCDPTPALLDVFIGAFKGLAHLHAQGYVHTELQNPGNILVRKCKGNVLTGILSDLDQTRKLAAIPTSSNSITSSESGKTPVASESVRLTARDVQGLFYSFLQILQDMKRKEEFATSFGPLKARIEYLLDAKLSAAEAALALQALRTKSI